MPGALTLLIGTSKGAFLIDGDARRESWALRGPFCDGWPINHVIGDPESGTIWAGGGGEWPGAGVWRSVDGGETWRLSKLATGKFDAFLREDPAFADQIGRQPDPPAPFDGRIDSIWSLGRAGRRLHAGARPAMLLASDDDGESWTAIETLTDHPSAPGWEPGGVGLTLHTIVAAPDDPSRIWLAISAAGVFASEDGGATWDRRNRRSNAPAGSDEVGLCVHNMVRAPGSDLLYQQNHQGVFRSPDGGRSWDEITAGLPSTFGFPVAVHPRDPATVWVLPLNGDTAGRFPPGASAAVWKTSDGGESWSARQEGLPARDCFFTVLRQAMATDEATPAGVYFGTNSGSIFASTDEGEHWTEIARHLPTVFSVKVLQRA
ncbi:exo-alpha-sialidase [Cereibacter sphaeroides]|uniref:WD40/YVTN/BNR-like repeat-containing protein n=1 Tax=Cereibacter sphaeroides TaxID=1063 RepID=UPI001F1CC666|nr:sialidase family protein [Cereibacter sphaeroides]MCE6960692.1 exo-alpha-sialidase [Cereibacter sphaeroides]MCE6970041.1 exo-alpha-sialidase [Cereibacter sphaeroides]MCE6973206.1 exo-alpha-sialidase [Cereibacter sphaeroides]